MARVLIVEDEVLLRSAMARGIGKMPGITVTQVGTLADALDAIGKQPPDMIVSDIDLPDRSGIELLGELGRRHLRIPILYVSAYVKAFGAQIPRHADVDVREKPLRLDELRTIIENRLAGASVGEEAPFAPADYLQLACLGHRSVVIDVEGGDRKGQIVVHDGMLWNATDARGEGEEAFRRLAFIPHAVVRVRTLRDDPGERIILGHWEQVLLDAACEYDEASRGLRADSNGGDRVTIEMPVAPTPRTPPTRPSATDPTSRGAPPPRPPAPTLPSIDVLQAEGPPTTQVSGTPSAGLRQSTPGAGLRQNTPAPGLRQSTPLPGSARRGEPPPDSKTVPSRFGAVGRQEPKGVDIDPDSLWDDPAPAEEPPAASRDPQEVAFEGAFEAGVEALLVRNYAEAYAAFERAAAIRPDDAKVLTNLERLRQLGHGPQPS